MFMGSSWRTKWSIIKCKLNKCKFSECFMGSRSCCVKMHELFNRILAWKKKTSLSVCKFIYLFSTFIASLRKPPSNVIFNLLNFSQLFMTDHVVKFFALIALNFGLHYLMNVYLHQFDYVVPAITQLQQNVK